MKKLFKVAGAAVLAGTALAGLASCDNGAQEYKYGELKVTFPTGNIRVAFDILALQLGYFDQESVKVTPVNIIGNNALTAIENESDTLDLLTAGFVADVQHIGKGASLTFVGGTAVEGGAIIAKSGNASKYQNSTTIIDEAAVADAKYGLQRNQAAWIVTRNYLKTNYTAFSESIDDEKNGKIKYFESDQLVAQAVQQGEVELGYLPLEYALLYKDSYNLEIVTATGALEPEYVCCREVTSKAKYEAKYDAFVAYEKARIRAWEYYADEKNQDSVVDIVAKYSGKEADYVRTYLYGGVTKFSTDPNKKGIISYAKSAYDAGVVNAQVDLSQNVSTGAYEKAITDLATANPNNAFYQAKLALYNEYNK